MTAYEGRLLQYGENHLGGGNLERGSEIPDHMELYRKIKNVNKYIKKKMKQKELCQVIAFNTGKLKVLTVLIVLYHGLKLKIFLFYIHAYVCIYAHVLLESENRILPNSFWNEWKH